MDARDSDTVESKSHARSGAHPLARGLVLIVALALVGGAATVALSPKLRARFLVAGPSPVPFQVRSTPEGAEVYVDDALLGKTPVSAQVSPGPHRVRVVRNGFRPWSEVVDPAAQPEVAPALERVQLATLVVESDPDRAEVLLDAERRGVTPVEIPDVEAGAHTVRVVKEPLYRPVLERIELKGGETRRLVVRLESGLQSLYEERIKKEPGKLSNYTELLHVHALDGEAAKAAAVAAQAAAALKAEDVPATDLGQFVQELRKIVKGQAGALDAASRNTLFTAVASLLEKLVLAAPSEYPRYGPLVTLLSQGDRFDDVYKICEKTVALPSGRGAVHYYVATVCLGQGETASATRLLERAIELNPSLYNARISLASAYHRADRYDDALRQYAEAEKHVPASSSAYYQGTIQVGIARLLVSKKDIAGAIARYKKALEIKAPPSYTCQWRVQFAELLLEQGRKQEAIEQYKEVARLADADSDAGLAARRALRRYSER